MGPSGICIVVPKMIMLQSFVMKKLERKNMDTYRAAGGSKAVLFVDDVNMCSVDSVGTHRPLEVLHHYLDHGLW